MKTLVFGIALSMVVLAPAASGRTIRVLSYNIYHGEGSDHVIDLNRIATIIKSVNPDLVALQELDQGNTRSGADVFQLERLAQLTGMKGYFGKTMDFAGGEYGNGVLVDPRLHVTEVVRRKLPSPAGGEPRAVIELGISFVPAEDADFRFFATHLMPGSDDSDRYAQAEFINALVANSTAPALLAGDLNSRPASRTMQKVFEQWTDATALTDPGISRTSQIDYVLYRRPDQWKLVDEGRFLVTPVTRIASDHFPILTELDWLSGNADFDANGNVGTLDLEHWNSNFGLSGSATRLDGDADGDQDVDGADFLIWQQQLGPVTSTASSAAVPEPASVLLLVMSIIAAARSARVIDCLP